MDQGRLQASDKAQPAAPAPAASVAGPRTRDLEALSATLNASPAVQRVEAMRPVNRTGLPDQLKAGIEAMSGLSLDGVKVHRNSSKPAQLSAHAYAQGSDIHLAPGQERHLPHEAWHVVQQAQGRVRPTMQLKGDVPVNDDAGLEHEADVMGARAVQLTVAGDSDTPREPHAPRPAAVSQLRSGATDVVQLALPVDKATYYAAHQVLIDQVDATHPRAGTSLEIMRNIEYIIDVVKPFLENRKELVLAYAQVDDAAKYWKDIERQMNPVEGFRTWARTQQGLGVFGLQASDAATQRLIDLANGLPEMHTVPAVAGGYQADEGIRGSMPAQQRILSNLPSGAVVHTGTPAVAGLDVPVLSNATFMGSALIPVALKRLVKDIHLHWRLNAVLDTRTPGQQAALTVTADQAGALRSWHMNGDHSLPALNQPDAAHPLHAHYTNTSQAGNVHEGDAPIGYAEYTGIDSDQNKVVLDYVNGHIYVTAVHYKYWYDTQGADPRAISGSLTATENAKPADALLSEIKSPWVKVEM